MLPLFTSQKPSFLLIDGHSLAFRAYYALAKSKKGPLSTSTGIPTSVCFGFLNSLLQVLEYLKPQAVALAFDRPEPTFRHQTDPRYKATRQATPEDFITDLSNLQEILNAFNLPIVTQVGYEADDVIATIAQQASEAGYQVKILSGDRDLFQLVDEEKAITVLYLENDLIKRTTGGSYKEFTAATVVEKLGVTPTQVVDFKALSGDESDNLRGVRGIGKQTAIKLLTEYDSLEKIYQQIDNVRGSTQQKLKLGIQDAFLCQKLAKLVLDVPLEITLEDLKIKGFDPEIVKPMITRLELKTLVPKIDRLQTVLNGNKKTATEAKQLSLLEPITIKSDLIKPQIIDTLELLTELVNLLKTYTNVEYPVAWDTETTSLDPQEADIVGIGCCWGNKPNEVAYIPIGHTANQPLNKAEVFGILKPILEDAAYPKVFQNTKYDRSCLRFQGITLAGTVFDTMLASYVLNPEQTHNLKDLSLRYLSGINPFSYEELNIGKNQTIADKDIETIATYCGLDCYATFALVQPLKAKLAKQPEIFRLLLEIEQPLEAVLADMEATGISLDVAYLGELSQQLEGELHHIETQAYQLAGEEFNLGSPKQLAEVLFEKLGLDRRKSRQTKTGYSTDHATLEKLQGSHEIIDLILEHRTKAKLKSTYVDALPSLISPKTQRIHTDFNQTVTATGRLSSSNPNLQNIPIRTEFSRQIRRGFLPQPGWLLVSADYSQIELRILAHLSQEPILLEAYKNNEDIHTVTAKMLFEAQTITPEQRRLGKIINFGVIYGMGPQRFAREAGVTQEEGKKFIDKYRQQYSLVFEYLEGCKKQAIAQGYVTTILGRRRYFNFANEFLQNLRGCSPEDIDLNSLKLNNSEAQMLRAAANAPIQGSSADIIKIAMVKLQEILKDYQAKILLQVHDELVLEIPPQEWEALQSQITFTMGNAVTEMVALSVPLVVDIHVGNNWMEAK